MAGMGRGGVLRFHLPSGRNSRFWSLRNTLHLAGWDRRLFLKGADLGLTTCHPWGFQGLDLLLKPQKMPWFLLCVRPPVSSSPAPGPSWPCGSVSPTWLTRLCPNGLGAHGLSRAPQPRTNPEWAPCAPPSWAWVGGSSLPQSGPSSLAHPHVSGPSSLCHPHVSGPSSLCHPHVSGPSSLCPSPHLRAQHCLACFCPLTLAGLYSCRIWCCWHGVPRAEYTFL